MSRLVPKHFDEKNMEKEEENTTHDFLILMIIILMMIMTTIINALLLVDVCKIRKIRKTFKVHTLFGICSEKISVLFCHFHFYVKLILGVVEVQKLQF